jgi:DNA-binding LacI/PurR family transcriptional regulator/DNA-binding transcriptional regulator YhcF (GntR family)
MAAQALQRALRYLATCIEASSRKGDQRLPTHQVLAARATVAPVTMLKAVAVLRKNGALTVSHGKGICIALAGNAKPFATREPERDKRTYLQRTCSRVEGDVEAGRYLPGRQFPPGKVMATRYDVSQPTLRKAMKELCRRGVAAESLRWYKAATSVGGARRASIVLIAAGDDEGRIEHHTFRTRRLVDLLVNECLQSDITLRIRPYDFRAKRHVRPLSEVASGKNTALGAIIFSTSLSAEVVRDATSTLARAGVPVAVLDETGDYEQTLDGMRVAGVRAFAGMGLEEPGHELGRYLCKLGHRCVAYVSCSHAKTYSQNRLAGLRRAMAEYAGDVVPFVTSSPEPTIDGPKRVEITDRLAEILVSEGHLPQMPEHLITSLVSRMRAMLTYGSVMRTCARLFEDALTTSAPSGGHATAWVTADDAVATAALPFLRKRKIVVPRDVSVASFDDTDDAIYSGLTSYNFNDSGTVRAMLSHLLAPRGSTTPTRYVVPGFISMRESVRPCA